MRSCQPRAHSAAPLLWELVGVGWERSRDDGHGVCPWPLLRGRLNYFMDRGWHAGLGSRLVARVNREKGSPGPGRLARVGIVVESSSSLLPCIGGTGKRY